MPTIRNIYDCIYGRKVGSTVTNVGHGLTTIGTKSSNATGLAFTCALDSGVYQHMSRNRDRFFNTAIEVTGVGNTFTASNAVFDPTMGIDNYNNC